MGKIRRRQLVLAAFVASLSASLPVCAQQTAKLPRIGYLDSMPENSPDGTIWREAFLQGLRELGWTPGRNVEIEYRSASGGPVQFAAAAAEMSRLNLSLIVTAGEPLIRAAQQANPTTPIVMATVGDPIQSGFAKSLARPGGKLTGTSSFVAGLIGKWLELIKAVSPRATRMAVVRNLGNPTHDQLWGEAETSSAKLGMSVLSFGYRVPEELEQLLDEAVKQRAGAMLVLPDPVVNARAAAIAQFALKNRLPSLYRYREHAVLGGLLAYGPTQRASYRRAATYVDKILRGADPGELPIEQAREFDLAINMKTASALGLKIPQSVLLLATEIID